MPRLHANGVDLWYEESGDADAPVILLVMGLGTQMIAWPVEFVDGLVARGFRVIRFDNRDVGLSQAMTGARAPTPLWLLAVSALRLPIRVPYTLTDMAADAIGVLDGLGIARAHVVGVSMGGMIAQLMAAGWPDRVLTLTSIMSSSGRRGLPGPTPEVRRMLTRRRPATMTRDEAIAMGADALRLIAYPDPARPADAFRDAAAVAFDRAVNPDGFRRQLAAIVADGSRVERLGRITAPTLVIHGRPDPLVPLAAGEDVARHVPGARLTVIEQMAHDLPPSQVAPLVDAIAGHAGAAG